MPVAFLREVLFELSKTMLCNYMERNIYREMKMWKALIRTAVLVKLTGPI